MPAVARRAGTMVWDAVPDPQDRIEAWPAMTALLPHALSCADHLGGQPEGADLAARLLTASGNFLKSRGDRRLARELIGQAVDLSIADEDAPIAAQQAYVKRLGNFGAINADLGDLDVAAEVHRRSMVRRERLYGPDAPETILAVNNLAGVLRDAGRNEEALPLMERAWRIRRDLPFEDERRGWGAHGLAFVLLALDRSGEALPYADEAIEVFSGPGRPPEGAAWADELRTEIRLALHDIEGARKDATSALTIRRRASEHHVDVGKALLASARVALAEGDDGRARRELTEALAVMEPSSAPSTSTSSGRASG